MIGEICLPGSAKNQNTLKNNQTNNGIGDPRSHQFKSEYVKDNGDLSTVLKSEK